MIVYWRRILKSSEPTNSRAYQSKLMSRSILSTPNALNCARLIRREKNRFLLLGANNISVASLSHSHSPELVPNAKLSNRSKSTYIEQHIKRHRKTLDDAWFLGTDRLGTFSRLVRSAALPDKLQRCNGPLKWWIVSCWPGPRDWRQRWCRRCRQNWGWPKMLTASVGECWSVSSVYKAIRLGASEVLSQNSVSDDRNLIVMTVKQAVKLLVIRIRPTVPSNWPLFATYY